MGGVEPGVGRSNTRLRHTPASGPVRAFLLRFNEEQGAATQEIARNVRQAAKLSAQVFLAAQSLAKESSYLAMEVQKLIAEIHAA